ncbi:MAG: hypothetical protein JOZ98_10465 [Solirubrobacterales bacterium]|nr:hypothetical protein [Solirubrobacterales bacterium]MBV9800999.1 hypothetical protein [Solirubrobacterales bacterium]
MRDTPELERELLRRGVDQRVAGSERCARCRRTPLIGERIYIYDRGAILCELCRVLDHRPPVGSRTMHTPAFGHTMRITDQRAA